MASWEICQTEDRSECGVLSASCALNGPHQACAARRVRIRYQRTGITSHLSGVVLHPFHLQVKAGLPRAMVTKRDSVHGNLLLQLLSPASPPTGQSAPGEPTGADADWSSGSDVTAKRCQAEPVGFAPPRRILGGGSATLLAPAPHLAPATGEWSRWLLAGATPLEVPSSNRILTSESEARSWKPWNSYPPSLLYSPHLPSPNKTTQTHRQPIQPPPPRLPDLSF